MGCQSSLKNKWTSDDMRNLFKATPSMMETETAMKSFPHPKDPKRIEASSLAMSRDDALWQDSNPPKASMPSVTRFTQ